MITNTWNIVALNCQPTADKLVDYVVTAHRTLSASDTVSIGRNLHRLSLRHSVF